MWQTALNTVLTAAVAALVAVLVAVVKAFGDAAVEYVQQKIKAVQQKVGADNYNQKLDFARQAWNITDEYFRITPTVEKTFAAKQAYFADQLKKLIPGLTDEEIEQLRQAIAGEVNKGKAAVTSPATPNA